MFPTRIHFVCYMVAERIYATKKTKNFVGINGIFDHPPIDHKGLTEKTSVMIQVVNSNRKSRTGVSKKKLEKSL